MQSFLHAIRTIFGVFLDSPSRKTHRHVIVSEMKNPVLKDEVRLWTKTKGSAGFLHGHVGRVSPVRKTSHSGFTRGRSCVRQPAVRIGDAAPRLRESQQSCRPTELAADLVNLYPRTVKTAFLVIAEIGR